MWLRLPQTHIQEKHHAKNRIYTFLLPTSSKMRKENTISLLFLPLTHCKLLVTSPSTGVELETLENINTAFVWTWGCIIAYITYTLHISHIHCIYHMASKAYSPGCSSSLPAVTEFIFLCSSSFPSLYEIFPRWKCI